MEALFTRVNVPDNNKHLDFISPDGLGARKVVCYCTVGGKDQGEDSPKQAGSCWFARHG